MKKAATGRNLRLSRETLRVLNQGSLEDVNGGTTPTIVVVSPATPGIAGFTIGLVVGATLK